AVSPGASLKVVSRGITRQRCGVTNRNVPVIFCGNELVIATAFSSGTPNSLGHCRCASEVASCQCTSGVFNEVRNIGSPPTVKQHCRLASSLGCVVLPQTSVC